MDLHRLNHISPEGTLFIAYFSIGLHIPADAEQKYIRNQVESIETSNSNHGFS